ncbi:hypothetical protein EVG20_g199 [Dentipellis fragilis]|uniref:F-box domain-containing protein n=1 Tax=Dentipellis fragilis TaxID=205917 RepID=A0A4Y9ZF26_9AGAM|nr:hypothetical protein EVG20_g199 [Dentipellis fragilis]
MPYQRVLFRLTIIPSLAFKLIHEVGLIPETFMDAEDGQLVEGLRIRDTALSKQQRNALSLVCSSPPEILQHIFQFYVRDKTMRDLRGTIRHALPRSAKLTHVCRRWRDVCFNDHRLWTTISYTMSRQWQSEYVVRSGDSPLAMDIFLEPHREDNILAQTAVDHVRRLRVLHVNGRQDLLQAFMVSLVNKAAPILESLIMQTQYSTTLTDAEQFSFVPADIFANTAPLLQSLALHWVRLPSSPVCAFTNLKTIQTEGSFSVFDTWMLLPSMRYVKAEKFSMLRNPRAGHPFYHSGRIHAPDLTDFEVYDVEPAILIKMLENLVAPSLSRLALCGIRLFESDLHFLSTAITRSLSVHFQLLRQKHGPIEEVYVDPERVVCWPTHYNDRLLRNHCASLFHIANGIFSILPAHETRTLCVGNHEWYPETRGERWACLYSFQNVTVLSFTTRLAIEALYMLLAMTPQEQRIDIGRALPLQDHVLFPHLTRLVFVSVRIRPHGGTFLRILSCMARTRRQGGTILEIAFQNCSYSAVVMAELKKDAVVTWDGIWCPPFSFGYAGEDPELENWENWGSLFDQQPCESSCQLQVLNTFNDSVHNFDPLRESIDYVYQRDIRNTLKLPD